MEKINCVGCKWLRTDNFRCINYCQLTKDWAHREDNSIKNILSSPIVPDNGVCPGWETEVDNLNSCEV